MGRAFVDTYPQTADIDPCRYVSYLPLCHVVEQMFTNFVGLRIGTETYFCSDLTKIKDHLVAARPHFFFAVPRVWEKFEAALEEDAVPDLCKAAGVPVAPLADVAANEQVRVFLADRVEAQCNSKVARYQTIKKFDVLPHMLSVEGGELTPTMKVKRKVIDDKYEAIIRGMYASVGSQ